MRSKIQDIYYKSLLYALAVSLLLTAGCTNSDIKKIPVEIKTLCDAKPVDVVNLRGIGSISVKQSIIIDGAEYYLFCTFDDSHSALADLQNAIPDYLSFLAKEYSLNRIALGKLDVYYEKMFVYEQYLIDNGLEDELGAVREKSEILGSFYRIYRLESRNNEIIKLALSNLSDEGLDYLMQLLPAFSPSFIVS